MIYDKNMDKECIECLKKYEAEESKSCLSGMAWDNVGWLICDMIEKYNYNREQLKEMFPNLCVNL